MTQYRIKKSNLRGEIAIPPSKSHTLRSILLGSLGQGKSIIHRYLPSPDTAKMMEACQLFGATINFSSERIEIDGVNGKIDYAKDVIHAGNSGIILRFCSAIGALAKNPVVITGDDSIRHQRPMKPLLHALSQLGVSAASMRGDDYAPVIIQGRMQSGKAVLNGEDSQHVSALLMAAAFAEGPVELHVENPGEKPWIGLTLHWLDRLGIRYENDEYKRYRLLGNSRYEGFEYTVPGDLSSAAFPIAAALVTRSELTLKNVDINDVQGDKELIAIFQQMGACIDIDDRNKTIHVKKGQALKGVEVDINNFVDGITILAVVACFAEGTTSIYNGAVAKTKECDRIHCIASELQKMGGNIAKTLDGLSIQKSFLQGAAVQSYHDHRMAMSLAVAALGAEGDTIISSVECISKTFPAFLQGFHHLGANIEELP